VLLLGQAVAAAEQVTGTIARVDRDKMTVTVTVGSRPHYNQSKKTPSTRTFTVTRDTTFADGRNQKILAGIYSSQLKPGMPVRVTTSGRTIATEVRLTASPSKVGKGRPRMRRP
jgi:hypothetical protein